MRVPSFRLPRSISIEPASPRARPCSSLKPLLVVSAATLATLTLLTTAYGSATDPFAGLPNVKTTAPKGATVNDGDFGIDEQRGAATYSFPIEVPPGRNGLAPQLALSYSSQAPLRGGIAVGWTGLELPYIDIEPIAVPGVPKFRVSGSNRLVVVNDVKAGATEVYRAEFDASFTRWERWGDVNSPTTTWVARSLDGSRMEFARAPQSVLSPGIVQQWRLIGQVDAYGNRILYHWDSVELNGRVSAQDQVHRHYKSFELGYIEYTYNPAAGLQAHARVTFNYALSPTYQGSSAIPVGAALSWTNGDTSIHPRPPADGIVTGPRELQSITTSVRESISAPWKIVRNVFFTYDYSDAQAGSQLRYLRKIDVSGYREACNASGCSPAEQKLPTVTFTYGDGPNGSYARHWDHNDSITYGSTMTLPRSAGHSGSLAGATAGFMDIDGDGIRDFVSVAAEPNGSGMDICTLTVSPGTSAGAFGSAYKVGLPTMNWKNYPDSNSPSTGHDFAAGEVTERCTLGGQYVLHHQNICLSGSQQTCCPDDYYAILGYHFVDYNGDGRVDVLTQLWRSAGFRNVTGAAYKVNDTTTEVCSTGPWDTATGACLCTHPSCNLPGLSPLPGAPPPAPAPLDPGGHIPSTGNLPGPEQIDCSEFYELIPEKNFDQTYLVTPHYFLSGHTLGRGQPLHAGVPLPPPGEEGVAEAMSQDTPFTLQMNADIDANGYMDLISTPSYQNGQHYKSLGTSESLSLWLGNGGQNFLSHDVGFPVPTFTMSPNQGIFDPEGNPGNINSNISINATLVDVNGDGRSDLVYRENASGHLWYFPNTGDRFAKPDYDLGATAPTSNNWYHVVAPGSGPLPDVVTRMQNVSLIDVDEDGRADLFEIVSDPLGGPGAMKPIVFFNLGDGFATSSTDLPLPWLAARNHFQSKANNSWSLVTELADVNGDGLPDLVDWDSVPFSGTHVTNPTPGRKVTWATDVIVDAPPRMLRRIDNGRGSATEFKYESSSALGLKMASPTWLVTKVKTTPDVSSPSNAMTTLYSYAFPKTGGSIVRDGTDFHALGFRGFEQVTVSAPIPAGNLHGAISVHRFRYENANGGQFKDGRGYQSATYAYDGAGTLQSVDRNDWEEVNLFGSLPIVRPTSNEHHVCTLQQQQDSAPETACGSSPRNMTKSYRNYSPYVAGTQVAFFQDSGSTSMRSDDDWVQNSYATYKIHYPTDGDSTYRMQPLTSRTTRRVLLNPNNDTTSREEIVYDSNGFPKWTKSWWGPGDDDYATTVRTYDPQTGNLMTVQKPLQAARAAAAPSQDKKTSFVYDPNKLYVAVETNELGHRIYRTRDLGTGAVTRVQGPQSVTVPGASCSPGPGCLNEVDFVIDAFGRATSQKSTYAFGTPDASSTSLVTLATTGYDDFHNTMTESHLIDPTASSPGWVTATTQYDPAGRIIAQDTCRGITSACPDPANDSVTHYSYDSAGLLVSMTMPNPAVEGADVTYTFQHDSLGRLTKLIRPGTEAAQEVQYSVPLKDSTDPNDPQSRDYGFILQRTAESGVANGKATVTRVDLAGRLVAVQECSAASCDGIPGNTQAAGWEVTLYEYDDAGRLTGVTNADGDNTALTYDLLGRRTSITRTRLWKYEYDLNGNMTAEISPLPAGVGDDSQYRSTTTYDDLDRPVTHEPARRGLTAAQQSTFWIGPTNYFYDEGVNGTGLLTRVEQPRPATGPYAGRPFLAIGYVYDGLGRVRQETRTFNTTGAASADVTQRVVRTWNALGAPMFAAWDDGQYTASNFDARGLVNQVTYTGGGSKTMTVADYGRRNRAAAPTHRGTGAEFAGQERVWTYDESGRVLTDRIQSPAGLLADRTYVFDARGLLKTASGSTRSLGLLPGTGSTVVRDEYTYDRMHRLTTAIEKTTGYGISLTYSPAGNINTARVIGVPAVSGQPSMNRDMTYNYDGFDPQAVVSLTDNVTKQRAANLVYDESGNMTTRSWPLGQDLQMTWDGENQLLQVRAADGSFERYHYDHAGQRVWAVKDTGTDAGTRYWFAESETFVPTAAPTTKRRYLYVTDGGGIVARAERVNDGVPTVELTYSDALQNLTLTTSVSGPVSALKVAVTSSFKYGAFGEVLAQGGETNHRREFNGKESDVTSGLRYYGARYYDPMLMRWNSADPLFRFAPDLEPEEPERLNLYAFTGNNPVQFFDPDGKNWATDAYRWAGREIAPRLDGAAKVVMGGSMVAVGGALCETGIGCVIGGALVVGGADYAGSGLSQAVYGRPARTAVGAAFGPQAQEFEEGVINAAATVSTVVEVGTVALGRYRAAKAASAAEAAAAKRAASQARKARLAAASDAELKTVSGGASSPGKMQMEVRRGQAPRDVQRVDGKHWKDGEPHVHYTDGTSSNRSGSVHDAGGGVPNPTNAARRWLELHGWIPPR
jgi:RHS repeat-associated protein